MNSDKSYKMVSTDDYKKAILAAYVQAKDGVYADYLLEPTPARFKKLSALLLNNNPADNEIYNRFFGFKDSEPQLKQIENFDTDKFKPLSNFVKGKSELTSVGSLDLLAVLVGYEQRPYAKFRKNGGDGIEGVGLVQNRITEESVSANNFSITAPITVSNDNVKLFSKDAEVKKADDSMNTIRAIMVSVNNSRMLYNILLVATGIAVLFVLKNIFFKEDSCMAWKSDHYEEVPCTVEVSTNGFTSLPVAPMDRETFAYQKKVQVCDTTTFFLPNGMPCIWYYKAGNDSIEYFTYPGLHPVTGKTLKKITPYMINKYVRHNR